MSESFGRAGHPGGVPWMRLTVKPPEEGESPLTFVREDSPEHPQWDRYVLLYGEKAWYLGNVCETCPTLLERMVGAAHNIDPGPYGEQLAAGLSVLDGELVHMLSGMFPPGEYLVCLHTIEPRLVYPGQEGDYFHAEQPAQWGVDPFWGLPHNPRTEYYRQPLRPLAKDQLLVELTLPMYPQGWLDPERIGFYQNRPEALKLPTALSLSLLDVREPEEVEPGQKAVAHWNLNHFLVDGHHKVYAAAALEQPVNLLSFIALDESLASEEQARQILEQLHAAPVPKGGVVHHFEDDIEH